MMKALTFGLLGLLMACPGEDPVGPGPDGGTPAVDSGAAAMDAGLAEPDGGEPLDSGPAPQPSEEEALREALRRHCAQIRQCWDETLHGSVTRHQTLSLVPSLLHLYADSAYCEATMGHSLQRFLGRGQAGVELNMDRYEACLEHLADCSALAEGIHSCAGFLAGMVAPGGRCIASMECQDEGYCSASGQQCGVCVARGAQGDACGAGSPCQRPLRCEAEQCVLPPPPVATGEACAPGRDLRCAGAMDLCMEGVCTTVTLTTEEGAACSMDGLIRCGGGLFCIHGQCTAERVGRGEPCGQVIDDGQPGPNRLLAEGVCADDSICVIRDDNRAFCQSPGVASDDCRRHDECAAGYFCDQEANSCRAHGAVGADCADYNSCASAACEPETSQCVEHRNCP